MARILGLQRMTASTEQHTAYLDTSDLSDGCSTFLPSTVSNNCCVDEQL
jgi:hypothetical protein